MLLSAYWHGLHPGYYLSFMTIPLCLAAEGYLESALRRHLSPGGQKAWDWVHWFLKMRAYDYMCMGFVLLSMADTLRYWASIYFWVHFLALACLGLGWFWVGAAPARGRHHPRLPAAKRRKSSGKSELCCIGLPSSSSFFGNSMNQAVCLGFLFVCLFVSFTQQESLVWLRAWRGSPLPK